MNWNRKQIKKQAKLSLKNNYAKMLLLCLIMMFFTSEFSNTKTFISGSKERVQEELINAGSGILEHKDNAQIIGEMFDGAKGTQQKAGEGETIRWEGEDSSLILGLLKDYHPQKGVLAGVFNSITASGSVLFGFLNAVNSMVFQHKIGNGVTVLIGAVIGLLYWLFIQNLLQIGERRYFLEARKYYKSRVNRVLLPFKVKRMRRIAGAMFKLWLYTSLWSFTVIGILIKRYSYYMVPFILAENPEVTGSAAITLSRNMMNGHKWRIFLLEVSLWGWEILSALTLGILGIFYVNPYKMSVKAELYMDLRRGAKEQGIPGAELMNDVYLEGEVCEEEYPVEDFTLPMQESRKWLNVDFRKDYPVVHLIMMFFIFAFVGWCWEVCLHLFQYGEFVNRGVLLGPWLPIYGFGGVLLLTLLKRFRENHLLTFLLTVLVCGVVEYVTSVCLEYIHDGAKWWDYTGYFGNINGRVCLEGLLVFGAGGCLFIYVVAPLLEDLLCKIPKKASWGAAVLLLVLFSVDTIHAKNHPNMGDGITDQGVEEEADDEGAVRW